MRNINNIMMVFNRYLLRGGEEIAYENERNLLIEQGIRVTEYTQDNRIIAGMSPLSTGIRTTWSRPDFLEFRRQLRQHRPQLIHVHNLFPLISPSILHAAAYERIPVVMTLHNYRLGCLSATFFRDGMTCEDCLHIPVPFPGILHSCYRQSRSASIAVAAMLTVHRMLNTWGRYVSVFIALSHFSRHKFIEIGLPPQRIIVKPNSLSSEEITPREPGNSALYVGRLSPEKGVADLVKIWKEGNIATELIVAGDGPLRNRLIDESSGLPIHFTGLVSPDRVAELMSRCAFVVVPSKSYEGFPMVILEAMAHAAPVVASRFGSIPELIDDELTGILVDHGRDDLWIKAIKRLAGNRDKLGEMGIRARQKYEMSYQRKANFEQLIHIYQSITGA